MKLSDLRVLAEKATEGPWWWDGDICGYNKEQEAPWLISGHDPQVPVLKGEIEGINPADAAFIAAARTYLPLLIEVAEAAERAVNHYDNDALIRPAFETLMANLRAALKKLGEG